MSAPPAAGEVDVWLTEWQVSEDRLQVVLDEIVTWQLVPMDLGGITKLFADRRTIPLQLDTYADATRKSDAPDWTWVRGIVVHIDQVSVQYVNSGDPSESGPVPEPGTAVALTVPSIWPTQSHAGSIRGWIVRIRMAERT